jgi:tetratricopeptide (TPR) repeat protein
MHNNKHYCLKLKSQTIKFQLFMKNYKILSNILFSIIISCFIVSISNNVYGANKKIDQLTLKLKTAKNTDRVNILNELCWEYRLNNLDKGLEYGQEALNLSEKIKFNNGEANAYINMAYIYTHKSMTETANDYYRKAINIYTNINNPRKTKSSVARIYEGLGLLYYHEKDYNKAITYYNKALRIYQELSTHKNISVCYRIIGMIYEKAGEKDKANRNYFSELKNTVRTTDKNILSSYKDFEKLSD